MTRPDGVMEPLTPALAAIPKVFSLKAALTAVLESRVRLQVGFFPEHCPDQPAKSELALGAALRTTRVPVSKSVPAGMLVTVPVPVPILLMLKGCRAPPV